MNTDITRQVSASVYSDPVIRDKIYSYINEPFNALVESYGINSAELLKHVCNARKRETNYYYYLLIPSLAFWILIAVITSGTGYIGDELVLFSGLILFTLIGIVFYQHFSARNFIKNNLSRNSYNASFDFNESSAIIKRLDKREGKNVVIYSGYTPFVGSGVDIGGWSFVVDIDKGKKDWEKRLQPLDFTEEELYMAIAGELQGLNIPNLTVKDKVFINGKTLREKKEILPDILKPPVDTVTDEFIQMVMNNDIKDARFYKVIQVVDWQGDLILFDFLRLKKDNKSLFVESNYFLLPPINERFKQVDSAREDSGIGYHIAFFFLQLLKALMDSVLCIFKVLSYLSKGISELISNPEAAKRKEVKSSPGYDYGATTSIREALSQTAYTQHFQKLDKERYSKIIEKRIFNLIGDFLDSKQIDSSEFRERESSILNQGVLVTGGNLQTDNLAVGKGSKIKFNSKNASNAK